MTYIIMDSIDKTGKDSLLLDFHKLTNYKYSAINRWSGTSYSYGKFWNRDLNYDDYLFQDLNVWNEGVLFYLECSLETLKERFEKHYEKDIDLKDVDKLKNYYEEYLSKTLLFVRRIDTDKLIRQCTQEMMYYIKEFEEESIIKKIDRLVNSILKIGNRINNTLELRNIILKFDKIDEKELYNELELRNLYDVEELYEYEMIYSYLRNLIRIKVKYLKSQNLESRQFVYHNDSCISFFQTLLRDNVLEVTVSLRSSNVLKSLLFDCLEIYVISRRLNEEYFKTNKMKFTINISSAHIYV